MANAIVPQHVPPSVAAHLRRDGDWLRCNEPNCGDFAFWGVFRDADYLRVKVRAHRAKMHAGRAPRPQAGRPQRRAALAQAPAVAAGVAMLVNPDAMAALQGQLLGQGIARKGYLPDVIVKHAKQGCEKHNLAEWQSYATAPAPAKALLCPPVMMPADGAWIMFRKAERVGDPDRHDFAALVRTLERYGVRDLHEGNVGYVDGKLVATDYGQGFAGSAIQWRVR